MSPAIADQPTRDLITRDRLDSNLFVEAGAGTGKTSQLVDRVVHLVLDRGIRLANIAAITFTEAAAAELQDRIRVAFEVRELRADDAVERDRCRSAIADADRAAVSTLHSFAKRILSEHPVAAGLPPRISVLDEVSSQLAREDRWERFVDALHADPDNEELLVRASLVGVRLEPQYRHQATLKDVAAELGQSWDRLDAAADAENPPLGAIDFSAFDKAVAGIVDLPEACADTGDGFYQHLTTTLIPEMRDAAALADPHLKLRALGGGDWPKGRSGRGGAWPGGINWAKDHVVAVNSAKDAVVGAVTHDVLGRLLGAVCRQVRDGAELRRREGGLEFHDLLVLARRLLRASASTRAALRDRYTCILLDEFQDTDPIQIELAVLLASAVSGDDPPDWPSVPVDAGRLFFVGDPKQSIYRFRRADIALFLRARDRFGSGENGLSLVTNFRSVAPIVEWVNTIFGRLMPEEVELRQPRYEPLVAERESSPTGDQRPVLIGGSHEAARAGELRELEAADVARAIEQIRRAPDEWPVLDLDTKHWRPAQLSDVTILVPTRTSLPFLRDALERAELPYRLDTGTLVYETQEVRDALAALRAIDDPSDRLSLVAVLRSPLFACSDVDLFTFRAAGGRWDLRREPPDELAPDHPVRSALVQLRSLWEQRWWLSPSALLDRVLRERRAFLLGFGDDRPNEVWRRLRFLLDQARAFEEAGGRGLRGFVEWAELQRSEGSGVHEPLLPETDDEAVRILTIHGSKGLEFPITILSGMTTKPAARRTGVSVLWGEDGSPEVRLRKGVATDNYDPRADIEDEMDEHEKLRLLYVACTRARDHLVVGCHHKAGDQSYACRLWETAIDDPSTWRALPVDSETADASAADMPASAAPRLAIDDADEWEQAREALLAPQRRSRFTSATAIAAEARAPDLAGEPVPADADSGSYVDADEAGAGAVATRRRGRAGTAIGRAVHATLQLVDLDAPHALAEQAAHEAEVEAVPEHAAIVAALARSALESAAVKSAIDAPHHKEMYVAAPVGDRVVEGYVDLLIETPGGLVVVDYKTDSVRSEAEVDDKLGFYELQGAAYAVALEAATGVPVVDCRFVFCRLAGAIERSVTDLDAAKQRVRAQLGS